MLRFFQSNADSVDDPQAESLEFALKTHRRFELDGLRAIAVLAVMFSHGRFERFKGGYVGVDIFFVLSGYLIAGLIFQKIQCGSFRVGAFFGRRVRRLAPALFLVLALCIPPALALMTDIELARFAKVSLGTLFGISNVLLSNMDQYFDESGALNPLLHLWSLGVEEQFYLVFPFLLLAMARAPVLRHTLLPALALLSFAFATNLFGTEMADRFYLLPARGWELLMGALGAQYLERRTTMLPAWLRDLAALAALAMIGFAIHSYEDAQAYSGWALLAPTLGALVLILAARADTHVGRLLGWMPMVGIGVISYSAYLWHQPLFAFARMALCSEPSHHMMLGLIAASLLLAALSYHLVETPFRTGRLAARTVPLAALAWILLFTSALLLLRFSDRDPRRLSDGTRITSLSQRLLPNLGLGYQCLDAPESAWCRTSPNPVIVVWGDSFAMHLVSGVIASDPKVAVAQEVLSQCPPILGYVPVIPSDGGDDRRLRRCLDFQRQSITWMRQQKSLRYVVIASPFSYLYFPQSFTDGGRVPTRQAEIERHFALSIRTIRSIGLIPVVVEPPPKDRRDLGQCVGRHLIWHLDPHACDFTEMEWRHGQRRALALVDKVARGVSIIHPSEALCHAGRCATYLDGNIIYRDEAHLSVEGSKWLGRQQRWADLIRNAR